MQALFRRTRSAALTTALSFLFILVSTAAHASGGYGGGGGGGFGRSNPPPQRVVDEAYEYGKAVFKGRAGAPKQRYCLRGEEEPAKLKSKTIKQYRGTSVRALADDLVLCDMGETLAVAALSEDQAIHLIYYLNKRYKLSLSGV